MEFATINRSINVMSVANNFKWTRLDPDAIWKEYTKENLLKYYVKTETNALYNQGIKTS